MEMFYMANEMKFLFWMFLIVAVTSYIVILIRICNRVHLRKYFSVTKWCTLKEIETCGHVVSLIWVYYYGYSTYQKVQKVKLTYGMSTKYSIGDTKEIWFSPKYYSDSIFPPSKAVTWLWVLFCIVSTLASVMLFYNSSLI